MLEYFLTLPPIIQHKYWIRCGLLPEAGGLANTVFTAAGTAVTKHALTLLIIVPQLRVVLQLSILIVIVILVLRWYNTILQCESIAEVRVRVRARDAGVSGSWEAVLRFFLNRSSLLMTR